MQQTEQEQATGVDVVRHATQCVRNVRGAQDVLGHRVTARAEERQAAARRALEHADFEKEVGEGPVTERAHH